MAEDVFARVTRDPQVPHFTDGFTSAPTVADLKVSSLMEVELTEAEQGTFEIVKQVPGQQAIVHGDYTEWRWTVKPLTWGRRKLRLSVSAVVTLSDKTTRRKGLSKSADIDVDVNPAYVASHFLSIYWQWLLGSPFLLGLVAWFRNRGKDASGTDPIGYRPDKS